MDPSREKLLHDLEQRLGYEFASLALLDTALTHTSYVKGEGRKLEHNERLEFLGDAVLELCVSEYLYTHFASLNEGHMTRIRANSVCETALWEAAVAFRVGDCLRLSRGEDRTGGREKPSILSDAMEAVIGAVFLDGGMDAARRLVMGFAQTPVRAAAEAVQKAGGVKKDFKTQLQEQVQQKHSGALRYVLAGETGPDHHKTFTMQVLLNGKIIGAGQGGSKQEAGQAAAEAALALLKKED